MIEVNCPNCGESNPAKYKFCPLCRAPLDPEAAAAGAPGSAARPVPAGRKPFESVSVASLPEKDHLFETVEETLGSRRSYLKLFGIVAAAVVIAGGAIAYMTLGTDIGDKVKASTDMELAIRDHFLLVEKRTATDIETYYCGDYHWSLVGVETRTDIPNPLLRVNKYTARATTAPSNTWSITAAPVTSPQMSEPCR